MAIVTLQQAKDHLRITTTDSDADLTLKLAHAEALVLEYCNTTAWWRALTPAWVDGTTTPPVVVAAILMQLGELDRFRGDDPASPARPPDQAGHEDLSTSVRELLRRSRDPVLV